MSSDSEEHTVDAVKAQSSQTCHLLKLSLELRDIIYEMLLTTPYCTRLVSRGSRLKFCLHTAILLVNKQISAEATRILYQGNDFIVLESVGMGMGAWLRAIPKFELLSVNKITSPVLRINIDLTGDGRVEVRHSQSLITTPDGLQSIIKALWIQEERRHSPDNNFPHGDMSLTLDFNLKAVSRYQIVSETVLRQWDTISSVEKLILSGDIKQPMREQLEKSNLEGPFQSDVAAYCTKYNLLAERALDQKDYDSAYWWWIILRRYRNYVVSLTPEPWGALKRSYYQYWEGLLKLVKACLKHLEYPRAAEYVNTACKVAADGRSFLRYGDGIPPPIIPVRYHLCASLARTALGEAEAGMEHLTKAAQVLIGCIPHTPATELGSGYYYKDFRLTINNELIRLKSLWRCGRELPLPPTPQTGPDWEVGVVRRSFWEWIELPADRENY